MASNYANLYRPTIGFTLHRRPSSAADCPGVDGGEGDGLGPPARVGALGEEAVDQPVVEVARGREAGAEFGDRVDPVGSPGRAAIVDGGLGGAGDLLQARGGEAGQSCLHVARASRGLRTWTPVPAKSASLRVTTISPCASAVVGRQAANQVQRLEVANPGPFEMP